MKLNALILSAFSFLILNSCGILQSGKVKIPIKEYHKVKLGDDFSKISQHISLDALNKKEQIQWAYQKDADDYSPNYSFVVEEVTCKFSFLIVPVFKFDNQYKLMALKVAWGGVDWSGAETFYALNNEILYQSVDLISIHQIDLSNRFQFSRSNKIPFVSTIRHPKYSEKIEITKNWIYYQIGLNGYDLFEEPKDSLSNDR